MKWILIIIGVVAVNHFWLNPPPTPEEKAIQAEVEAEMEREYPGWRDQQPDGPSDICDVQICR